MVWDPWSNFCNFHCHFWLMSRESIRTWHLLTYFSSNKIDLCETKYNKTTHSPTQTKRGRRFDNTCLFRCKISNHLYLCARALAVPAAWRRARVSSSYRWCARPLSAWCLWLPAQPHMSPCPSPCGWLSPAWHTQATHTAEGLALTHTSCEHHICPWRPMQICGWRQAKDIDTCVCFCTCKNSHTLGAICRSIWLLRCDCGTSRVRYRLLFNSTHVNIGQGYAYVPLKCLHLHFCGEQIVWMCVLVCEG